MASSEYGITMIIIHTGGKRYPIMATSLASHEEIDAKKQNYKPIAPSNLDYAVRSVRPVTDATAPTVTIQSTYGMTEFDFTPEANKIYSLFFDSGIIAVESSANVYGRRISYAEYDYMPNTEYA